ncbi:hypothetical protein F5Y16DRAFT_395412 [Xylariaceae sp. FL0255]|nr:hypothetical protein F5Y16DRAFT_395412 [Xylariaceae sp. FL0255]
MVCVNLLRDPGAASTSFDEVYTLSNGLLNSAKLTQNGDLKISQTSVESVTLKRGPCQVIRKWVSDIQILYYNTTTPATHYTSINSEITENDNSPNSYRLLDYAQIVMSYETEEDNSVGANIRAKLTSKAAVETTSIEAVETHSERRATLHETMNVIIQFTTRKAAREFHDNYESMRKELFVQSL